MAVLRRVLLVAEEQPTWIGGLPASGTCGRLGGRVWLVERDERVRVTLRPVDRLVPGREADELVRVPAGAFRCWRTDRGGWEWLQWWTPGLSVPVREVRQRKVTGARDVREELELVGFEVPP